MPTFTYTALNRVSGESVQGSQAARTKQEVYRELERLNLVPVSVTEGRRDTEGAEGAPGGKVAPAKMRAAQIILFTDELADMLESGLQLEQALRIMQTRQADPAIQRVSQILREEIREGQRLAAALKKASPSFDEIYRNMVAAGEASGSLTKILRRLASNLLIMHELKGRVVSAMIYPLVLIGACSVLLIVFATVLMPQLMDLITSSNQKLPVLTQVLVNFSHFMGRWWWAIVLGGTAVFLTGKGYVATPAGRAWWDRTKLHLSLIGPVLTAHYYAQYCHGLSNLLLNGVPMLNALRLLGRATPNVFLCKLQEKVAADVAEGVPLSKAMSKAGSFPGILTDVVGMGEKTGHLGESLAKAAARYDKELNVRISRLTTLISPVVLIFMAIIVGVVAYAIITTLFQSATGIRGTV